MKMYKTNYYGPTTSEKTEVETKIPADMVNKIKQALDNLDLEGYTATQPLINPEDKSVVINIIEHTDIGAKLQYFVRIQNK